MLPLGTFSPRVDGCNTSAGGRTQHLQLVDDACGSAQLDEDEDKHKDKNNASKAGVAPWCYRWTDWDGSPDWVRYRTS